MSSNGNDGPSAIACILLMLPLSGTAGAPQSCDTTRYPLSTPSAQFEDHRDGSVTDTKSKLMWPRCIVGQEWSGDHCVGEPKQLTWQEAGDAANELNASGALFYKDWRVPQVGELATIAERQCQNPRINLTVFPATPVAAFWSVTSRHASGNESAAFALSFGPEGISYEDKQARHFVRLVRTGP